ncbi:hypothetical protein [Flavobacterium sp. FlaQc-50]|uniref:hypothetical protein n=1 Tax=unclassified Flavobacterium TaxID=196869 RepID=UPI003756D951
MDLNKLIIENKNEYYNLAIEYLKRIDIEEYGQGEFNTSIPKSISVLIDHDFIPTPCIKIRLNLLLDQKETGKYFLYINQEKEFIDEFLMFD